MRNLIFIISTLILAVACIKSVDVSTPVSNPADPEAVEALQQMVDAAAEEAAAEEAAPADHSVHAEHAEGAEHADGHEHAAACTCPDGKAGNTIWCDNCGVGYIDGEKTTDKGAYEVDPRKADELKDFLERSGFDLRVEVQTDGEWKQVAIVPSLGSMAFK
jgi:hypothetical protein